MAQLKGGKGNSLFLVDNLRDIVSEVSTLATEIDTVRSSINYILKANVENLILTGIAATNGTGNSLNNTITGNSASNRLSGGAGNDIIAGGVGADILSGGIGADRLTGGSGNDLFLVDNLRDIVSEVSTLATEIDTVRSSINYILKANVENLILTGIAATNGTGNSLNNTITGNSASNRLSGGAGNDIIAGGVGTDILSGGIGTDILSGGGGNDRLTGSSGSDKFLYNTNTAFAASVVGKDIITDFSGASAPGGDLVVLDKTTFKTLSSAAGSSLLAAEFASVSNDFLAGRISDDIVYSRGTDRLFYNQNGTAAGFGTGGEFATLTGIANLAATDFLVVA